MGWFDLLWRKPKRDASEGPYTSADFPVPDSVINSDPIPWDASVIRLKSQGDKVLFTVSCCDPMTRGAELSESNRLELALQVTPGATASRSKPLYHIEAPGGVGDEFRFHPYSLEVNESNVLALTASGLAWSPEARRAAHRYPVSDEVISSIKRRMLERYVGYFRKKPAGPASPGQDIMDRVLPRLIELWKRDLGLEELPAEPDAEPDRQGMEPFGDE
jgi:hypothetical protein